MASHKCLPTGPSLGSIPSSPLSDSPRCTPCPPAQRGKNRATKPRRDPRAELPDPSQRGAAPQPRARPPHRLMAPAHSPARLPGSPLRPPRLKHALRRGFRLRAAPGRGESGFPAPASSRAVFNGATGGAGALHAGPPGRVRRGAGAGQVSDAGRAGPGQVSDGGGAR